MYRANRLLLALWFSAPVFADPQIADHHPTPTSDVAALLALQRSGHYASPHPQTLPGDAQSRLWQRYLDSFTRPIPAQFIDHAFKEK